MRKPWWILDDHVKKSMVLLVIYIYYNQVTILCCWLHGILPNLNLATFVLSPFYQYYEGWPPKAFAIDFDMLT